VIYWDLKVGGEFVRGWWKQGGQLGFLSSDGRFVSILNYIKPGELAREQRVTAHIGSLVANYGRGARVTAHIEPTNNNKQQLAESNSAI
jgi:hypothetical protein